MIKAILAIDNHGGVSKNGSMPWPHNKKDMQWFKKNTENQIVIMGKTTWIDPKMPTPLTNRINVLITNHNPEKYPGADVYIKGDILNHVKKIELDYPNKTKWIIGGPNTVSQVFSLIGEFYLTRIYGNFSCDTFLDLNMINNEMKIKEKIDVDDNCHFEIWKR